MSWFLYYLQKVPGCTDIIEWLTNDEADDITDNDIVVIVANVEVTEDEQTSRRKNQSYTALRRFPDD